MELREPAGLILDFPAHALGHEQDADGAEQVNQAGDAPDGLKIIFKMRDQRRGHKHREGREGPKLYE